MQSGRIAALALALALPAPASAWAIEGHMAVGAIAYDALARSDPGTVRDISAIMIAHPDHARFERNLAGLSGAARDRRLFKWMGQWPDDVRLTRWDHPEWHYAVKVVSGFTPFALTVGEAHRQFDRLLAVARDGEAKPAERALALCWLFHIVGDMHSPLHAGHRLSWRFPLTDRAGTIASVRRAPGAPPIELHQAWDRSPERPLAPPAGADIVAAEAHALAPRVPQASFPDWVRESQAISARYVYRGAAMDATRDPKDAPVLSPAYLADARRISERRIGQAGLRLAELLRGI